MQKDKVLFVCVHNAARSQMAVPRAILANSVAVVKRLEWASINPMPRRAIPKISISALVLTPYKRKSTPTATISPKVRCLVGQDGAQFSQPGGRQ
jgi:hypothetical protein